MLCVVEAAVMRRGNGGAARAGARSQSAPKMFPLVFPLILCDRVSGLYECEKSLV